MRKTPSFKQGSTITAEQKKLLQQQEQLRRKEEELKRLLEKKKKEEKENLVKLRAEAATRTYPGARPVDRQRDTRGLVSKRTMRAEQRAARVKFLILCLILATVAILLWRNMP